MCNCWLFCKLQLMMRVRTSLSQSQLEAASFCYFPLFACSAKNPPCSVCRQRFLLWCYCPSTLVVVAALVVPAGSISSLMHHPPYTYIQRSSASPFPLFKSTPAFHQSSHSTLETERGLSGTPWWHIFEHSKKAITSLDELMLEMFCLATSIC